MAERTFDSLALEIADDLARRGPQAAPTPEQGRAFWVDVDRQLYEIEIAATKLLETAKHKQARREQAALILRRTARLRRLATVSADSWEP